MTFFDETKNMVFALSFFITYGIIGFIYLYTFKMVLGWDDSGYFEVFILAITTFTKMPVFLVEARLLTKMFDTKGYVA